MNIKELRSSFVVYIADTTATDLRPIKEYLANEGYTVHFFVTNEDLQKSIPENPPHIVLCSSNDEILFGGPFHIWFNELKETLPEVHLILAAKGESLNLSADYFEHGVYDCQAWPVDDLRPMLRAVDRAAECDYYLYMNEQLKEGSSEIEASQPIADSSLPLLDVWMEQLYSAKNYDKAVTHYLREISRYLKGVPIIYLKYLPGYESLVVSHSEGIDLKNLSGVGIQLDEEEANFEASQLKRPEKLASLSRLIREGFLQENYFAHPVMSGHRVSGVLCYFADKELDDPYIKVCLQALGGQFHSLDLQKKLHRLSSYDENTHVLNRQHLLKRITEEVSRARRTSMPLSFMIISIDGFRDVTLDRDPETGNKLLKNLAAIIEKNSRVNDIVGRLGSDEFGVLMSHTARKGGAIKAERLRRIIETADFSKILPEGRRVTVSVGISEYPSLCQDADELLQSADEALYEVKKTGANKVCLAKVPEDFTPDFEAKDL